MGINNPIRRIFRAVIENALFSEYDAKFTLPREAYALLDQLTDKYTHKIVSEIRRLALEKKKADFGHTLGNNPVSKLLFASIFVSFLAIYFFNRESSCAPIR